jgi:hypothetical protein
LHPPHQNSPGRTLSWILEISAWVTVVSKSRRKAVHFIEEEAIGQSDELYFKMVRGKFEHKR